MAYFNADFPTALPTPSYAYHQLASRFQDPVECLAAHLMLECSEVLAGVKPANLVSLVNRTRSCGRNLYQLWQSHHNMLFTHLGGLNFKILQTRENALLLFCYNPDQLENHLAHQGIRTLLKKAGYDTALSSAALLEDLCGRFKDSGTFPHEIGLFIGYPAKDVAAFMGLVKLPFACQGPWKIYGDPAQSLCLADAYRRSRAAMGNHLAGCNSPFDCLDHTDRGEMHFFCPNTDKDCHF